MHYYLKSRIWCGLSGEEPCPGRDPWLENWVNRGVINCSIDSRKSSELHAEEERARWGRQFHCTPGHLKRPETHKSGLSENWGQESDTTENKLQIHIHLERKTNDKQKTVFTEKPKSWPMGTEGAASALQTLGACDCTRDASDVYSKPRGSLLKPNDPLTGECPAL